MRASQTQEGKEVPQELITWTVAMGVEGYLKTSAWLCECVSVCVCVLV